MACIFEGFGVRLCYDLTVLHSIALRCRVALTIACRRRCAVAVATVQIPRRAHPLTPADSHFQNLSCFFLQTVNDYDQIWIIPEFAVVDHSLDPNRSLVLVGSWTWL